MKLKPLIFLSLGIVTTTSLTSCAVNSTSRPLSLILNDATHFNSWSSKVAKTPNPVQYQWNANKTQTMNQMLDQMNHQMHFNLPINLQRITPYQFANYILNFYLSNGGTQMSFKVSYKNQSNIVKVNGCLLTKQIIESFDGPPPISQSTTRFVGTPIQGMLKIAKKLGGTGIVSFIKLFGYYGKTIFGTDNPFKLLIEIEDGTNKIAINLIELMANLPAQTISFFPNFFQIFRQMGNNFINSPISEQWAKDHGIYKEFQNVDQLIVKWVINSGN